MSSSRLVPGAVRPLAKTVPPSSRSSLGVRHLLGIKDLTPQEFVSVVRTASNLKQLYTYPQAQAHAPPRNHLTGRTVAMMFSKLSTRTRVSTEVAVNLFGGHAMYLGKNDIQLGVNETVRDTAAVLSEMVAAIFARVHDHSEILELAEHSKVPIINALSADHHPLQTIADFQTMTEALAPTKVSPTSLSLEGRKVAWIGDANNVLFDLASGCLMSGMEISVAAPEGYGIPAAMRDVILGCARGASTPGNLVETNSPEEAVKDADVIVTDTWTSMGWEDETAKRLKAFAGYQVTEELARKGGAKKDWIFLHCLPRHQEEVNDEVFYGPRSWVFTEAQNRVWAAASVLDSFIVSKGHIRSSPDMTAIQDGLTPSSSSEVPKMFP